MFKYFAFVQGRPMEPPPKLRQYNRRDHHDYNQSYVYVCFIDFYSYFA